MQLTTRTDNAIRILLYLAAQQDERWVPTAELAAGISISAHSVQKLVYDLQVVNLVRTTQGRYGGVRLVRDLAGIRVSEVVAVSEKDAGWKFTACDRRPDCDCYLSGGRCTLRIVFRNVQEQIMKVFDGLTMAQLQTQETDEAAREHAQKWRTKLSDNEKVTSKN